MSDVITKVYELSMKYYSNGDINTVGIPDDVDAAVGMIADLMRATIISFQPKEQAKILTLGGK